MMLDWNGYAKELSATVAEIAAGSPDILRGYRTLGDAGKKTSTLGVKTRELIALAVAVTRQCDGCITMHTDAAIKAGATHEELIEALGVAIAGHAGAALVYSARTLDAFKAKTQARPPPHPGDDAVETDSRDSFPASDPPSWTATTRTGGPNATTRDDPDVEATTMFRGCAHLRQVPAEVTPSADGCEECLAMGDDWVHLRLCLTCGHVGCCDSSKNKHAAKHFHAAGHPVMQSFEPGETWKWCYVDRLFMA